MGSKRLSKREIREQQELSMLAGKDTAKGGLQVTQQEEEEDQQEQEAEAEGEELSQSNLPTSSITSAFAMLMDQQDQDADEDQDKDQDQEDQEEEAEPEQSDLTSTVVASKSSKKKKNKKKKKKPTADLHNDEDDSRENQNQTDSPNLSNAASTNQEAVDPDSSQTPKPKRKKKKKTTAADKIKDQAASKTSSKSTKVEDMSMDELSSLLASTSTSSNNSDQKQMSELSSISKSPLSNLRKSLLVNPTCLEPYNELYIQFGSAAVKAFNSSEGTTSNTAMSSGRARAMAQSRDLNRKARSILVRPGDTWPAISRTFTGLEMRSREIGKDQNKEQSEDGNGKKTKASVLGTGQKEFWWEHSRAYRQVQLQFIQATKSFDTEALSALWRVYPWHIDTLLQLSEVSRQQGDLGQAGDFVSRALFAFERTDGCNFVKSFLAPNSPNSIMNSVPPHSSNPAPLPFERIENRAFYLAAHRHVSYLGRRGVWRTTLEWCKFILAINTTDPHAMILWVDFLGVKSGQNSWLLEFYERLETLKGGEGSCDWNVGLCYAKALALRNVEKEEKDKSGTRSNDALRRAISLHPYVVEPLLSKVNLSLPPSLSSISHPSPSSIQEILSLIYVNRSNSLWKPTSIANWLLSTAVDLFSSSSSSSSSSIKISSKPNMEEELSFYRHIIVSDLPDDLRQELIRLVPSEIVGDGEALNASDPLPPPDHTSYDDDYFANAGLGASRRGGGARNAQENAANARAIRAQQQIAQLGSHGIFQMLLAQFTSTLEAGDLAAAEREQIESMKNELEELRNQLAGMDERTRVDILTPLVLGMGAHPAVLGGNAAAGGGMPGGWGAMEADEDDNDNDNDNAEAGEDGEETEEEDDDGEARPAGGGWLNNWFGRGN